MFNNIVKHGSDPACDSFSCRPSTGRCTERLLTFPPYPELRPHPPTPLGHPKPRPPSGSPLTKTSLSRTSSLCKITSPLNNSSKIRACNTTNTSEHSNTQDAIINHNSPSPKQDGVHHRSSTSGLPICKTHLSPHHSLSREDSLLPKMREERKSSPACMSRKIHTPRLTCLCCQSEAGSSSTTCSLPATYRSGTQNRQQISSCGRSSESVKVNSDRKTNTSESSVIFETGSPRAQHVSNSGGDGTKNSCSLHTQVPSPWINGQLLTSPKIPHGGATSLHKAVQDAQTEPQLLTRFYKPVPPLPT